MAQDPPTHPTRRKFLADIIAAGALGVAPKQAFAANTALLTPRDIRGPAILYITYGACSSGQIHDFKNIENLGKKGATIYAITLTPESDGLAKRITYIDRNTPSANAPFTTRTSPGIHIFPSTREAATAFATQLGLPVNPNQLSAHSNRLVFINRNNQVVARIPSTQPLENIIKAQPNFFLPKGAVRVR